MKKTLFTAVAMVTALAMWAVPALRQSVTLTQTDGSQITVSMVGDEFHHSFITADGLPLWRADNGDFYYRTAQGVSQMMAHNAADRTAAELQYIAAEQHNLSVKALETNREREKRASARKARGPRKATQVPVTGSPRIPIILVQFQDKSMSSSMSSIDSQYFKGNKSAYQYFKDQSNGQYTPQYDLYGIYTLPQNRAVYGTNDYYGNDQGLGTMVIDAIEKAGNDIDWSIYDNDGDGEADVCIVLYAGVGEAQAYYTVPQSVWPCQWTLEETYFYGYSTSGPVTRNNTRINKFAVFNEVYGSNDNGTTLDGIGTFCHEFSHCLGLPDFYETAAYTMGYYGMCNWSLMDHGCYNDRGYTPIGYSAYEKSFMNWVNLLTPVENTYYTLPAWNQKNAETDQAIKMTSHLNANEYFVLENRRKQGWDAYIPGEGLLISHVTYVPDRWDDNTVNNEELQLMTIMAADGDADAGNESTDVFGVTNHKFTKSTDPKPWLNLTAAGTLAGTTGGAGVIDKPVTDININPDGTVSFWYVKGTDANLSTSVQSIVMDTVTLGNESTATFRVSGANLTDDVTLTLTDENNVFTVTPLTISAADAMAGTIVTVKFKSTTGGTFRGSILLTTPGCDNVTVALSATTLGPEIVARPTVLNFTEQYINDEVQMTVVVGGFYLSEPITATIDDPNDVFSLVHNTIPIAEAATGYAGLEVKFKPKAVENYTATLTLKSRNAADAVITLMGTGRNPVVTATPLNIDFPPMFTGETETIIFEVRGTKLSNDVSLTLNDENGVFAIDKDKVTLNELSDGSAEVRLSFSPVNPGSYEATIVLSSAPADPVTMHISGEAEYHPITTSVPVMQPAEQRFIDIDKFRARWTDETQANYVKDYTLWVAIDGFAPAVEMLEEADFSGTAESYFNEAEYYADYLPAGWTCGRYLYPSAGSIRFSEVNTKEYALPNGHDKMSVVVNAKSYYSMQSALSTFIVTATSTGDEQQYTLTPSFADYTYVLNTNHNESLKLWAETNFPYVKSIKIYAGDVTTQENAPLLAVVENGDSIMRVIEGITTTYSDVTALQHGGTFNYKVKARYVNGTESEWSNIEQVTLTESTWLVGDVDRDGKVNVSDVTALVNMILGVVPMDQEVADVDGNGKVNVSDVTALVNIILGVI